MSQATVDGTVAMLVSRLTLCESLVRWLSLTYGDNEPVFAGADGRATVNGQPIDHAASLHLLYHQIVGTTHAEFDGVVVIGADGVAQATDTREMVQCPACKRWNVERRT